MRQTVVDFCYPTQSSLLRPLFLYRAKQGILRYGLIEAANVFYPSYIS